MYFAHAGHDHSAVIKDDVAVDPKLLFIGVVGILMVIGLFTIYRILQKRAAHETVDK